MEPLQKFALPSPKFSDSAKDSLKNFSKLHNPHFSTPLGMLLPRDKQPPPMYGPRGPTIPPKFLRNETPKTNFPPRSNESRPRFNNPTPSVHTNWDAYCETCDKDFANVQELEKHVSEHQKCGVEGCTFKAHFLVLKKHKYTIHQSGLFEKIKKTETPEEIAKWRAERKKRYPTKINVELRQQAQEERMNRGERIPEARQRFGNDRDRNRQGNKNSNNNVKGNRNRKRGQKRKFEPKNVVNKPLEVPDTEDEEPAMYKKFKGTSEIKDYNIQIVKKTNALANLMGMYGSSDEEDSQYTDEEEDLIKPTAEPVTEASTSKQEVKILENTPKAETKSQKKNRKRKDREIEKQKEGFKEDVRKESAKAPEKKEKPLLNYSRLRHSSQNTMLEKLLLPDIKHERNVLLQCVRFVVQNKFFNVGAENK